MVEAPRIDGRLRQLKHSRVFVLAFGMYCFRFLASQKCRSLVAPPWRIHEKQPEHFVSKPGHATFSCMYNNIKGTLAMQTLTQLRVDFDERSRRSLSLPIAGMVVWCVVGILGMMLPSKAATLALVFATGAIFPLAMGVARLRGEQLIENANPLARLMFVCVVMVNLLWAVHIPLLMHAPRFVPLSLGIALGLHWMVYSWIIAHPLGYRHAVLRTVGLVAVWFAFPAHPVTASAAVVVMAYAVTIVEMCVRPGIAATPSARFDRASA